MAITSGREQCTRFFTGSSGKVLAGEALAVRLWRLVKSCVARFRTRHTPKEEDDLQQNRNFRADFIEQLKTSKSNTQNAEGFLIRFRQCRGRLMLIQRLKHPRSQVNQEQALRSGVYENELALLTSSAQFGF